MRSLSRNEGCISDLAFDELHAGELDASARAGLQAHLTQCTRCHERFQALGRERDAMLAELPSLQALRPSTQPSKPKPKRAQLWAMATTALAIAASVLLWVRPSELGPQTDTRSKGAPHLGVIVKRGERTWRAESGAAVRAGDRLRFTYTSSSERYVAIVSLDAKSASVYFPQADHAQQMPPASDVALDFGVELDDTAGEERVHGIFCAAPWAIEPVRAALEARRALPELAGCTVDVIVLSKEP